jgi:uncharacterized protein (TIGR02996 family)
MSETATRPRPAARELDLLLGEGRADLRHAIAADPEDDAPRLIYADALQETGDDEANALARLIRLDCTATAVRERSEDYSAEAVGSGRRAMMKEINQLMPAVSPMAGALVKALVSSASISWAYSGIGVPRGMFWLRSSMPEVRTAAWTNRGFIATLEAKIDCLFAYYRLEDVTTFFALEPVQFVCISDYFASFAGSRLPYRLYLEGMPAVFHDWLKSTRTDRDYARHWHNCHKRHKGEAECLLALSDAVIDFFRARSNLRPYKRTRPKLFLELDKEI